MSVIGLFIKTASTILFTIPSASSIPAILTWKESPPGTFTVIESLLYLPNVYPKFCNPDVNNDLTFVWFLTNVSGIGNSFLTKLVISFTASS